jgi:phospholipid transport system transporter-binding protein
VTKLTVIHQGAGDFVVNGDLTFATIGIKTLRTFDFTGISKQISIDLTGVASTDSAGLALMIEWIKYARQHRVHIVFKNIPEQLLNLAKLSGLDKTAHFAIQPSEGAAFEPSSHIETI